MWSLLFITLIIVAIAVAALAIKIFLIKGGEFRKSCSSVDPATGQRIGCTCGHGEGGSACENKL